MFARFTYDLLVLRVSAIVRLHDFTVRLHISFFFRIDCSDYCFYFLRLYSCEKDAGVVWLGHVDGHLLFRSSTMPPGVFYILDKR